MPIGGTRWQVRRQATQAGLGWDVGAPQHKPPGEGSCLAPCVRRPHPTFSSSLCAGLQFRTATYNALGARLKQLADQLCSGRIVFMLEGGCA